MCIWAIYCEEGWSKLVYKSQNTSLAKLNYKGGYYKSKNDLYYDFKRNNLDDNDILDKNQSLRGIMKPLTLSENIENLRNVGFEKIDVFMKYNNFVGIMAIK